MGKLEQEWNAIENPTVAHVYAWQEWNSQRIRGKVRGRVLISPPPVTDKSLQEWRAIRAKIEA